MMHRCNSSARSIPRRRLDRWHEWNRWERVAETRKSTVLHDTSTSFDTPYTTPTIVACVLHDDGGVVGGVEGVSCHMGVSHSQNVVEFRTFRTISGASRAS